MKNRSTNRAEGTHAAMKSCNLNVRDKMATATENIVEWYEIRVSRRHQTCHCFFPIFKNKIKVDLYVLCLIVIGRI
jgi:hypothetical protein